MTQHSELTTPLSNGSNAEDLRTSKSGHEAQGMAKNGGIDWMSLNSLAHVVIAYSEYAIILNDSDMLSCVYRQRGAQISSGCGGGRPRSVVVLTHIPQHDFEIQQPHSAESSHALRHLSLRIHPSLLLFRHTYCVVNISPPCTHHQGHRFEKHCDVAFQRLRRMQPSMRQRRNRRAG